MSNKKTNWNDEVLHRLSAALYASGKNQKVIAEELSVTQAAVSRWFSGKTETDWETLTKLISIIGTSADYILGLSNEVEGFRIADTLGNYLRIPFLSTPDHIKKQAWQPHEISEWAPYTAEKIIDLLGENVIGSWRVVGINVTQEWLGWSMVPTIRPGARLLCDLEYGDFKPGYYIVEGPEGVTCRRLDMYNKILMMHPDNRDYWPFACDVSTEDIRKSVYARVICVSQAL